MRNPEYQFIDTKTDPLIARAVARYEQLTKTNVSPASPEMLMVRYIVNAIIQERILNNYTGNQNIPSRADDENLDALGDLFYEKERPAAQPAVSVERFYISETQTTSILIPAGTRVTDGGGALIWETTSDVYIPIGSIYADVDIQCLTAGVTGNGYAPGQINSLVDVDNIAYFDRCENITISDNGADRATDEEYYNRMRESEDARSTAGARGAYVYFAKKVSTEIVDVVPNSPLAGEVHIYVLMRDGTIASETIKDKVYESCNDEDVRPLTDYVTVEDPEVVSYDIDFTYYILSNSDKPSAVIEQEVAEAVSDYIKWQCEKFGRDINPDELRRRIKETGVKRLEIISPTFTMLRDGKDDNVPQIAAVSAVNVVSGGFEDE